MIDVLGSIVFAGSVGVFLGNCLWRVLKSDTRFPD